MNAHELWEELDAEDAAAVARRHGLTVRQLIRKIDASGITGWVPGLPTPEEIEEAAAIERSRWSPKTLADRKVGGR